MFGATITSKSNLYLGFLLVAIKIPHFFLLPPLYLAAHKEKTTSYCRKKKRGK